MNCEAGGSCAAAVRREEFGWRGGRGSGRQRRAPRVGAREERGNGAR